MPFSLETIFFFYFGSARLTLYNGLDLHTPRLTRSLTPDYLSPSSTFNCQIALPPVALAIRGKRRAPDRRAG